MKQFLSAIGLLVASASTSFAGTDPYIGEIMTTATSYCPQGFISAEGQTLQIQQYQVLFALLGTTYGGNGTTTFMLPNLKPVYTATRATLTQCIALQGVYPSRP